VYEQVDDDSVVVDSARRKRRRVYLAVFVAYVTAGLCFYWATEGWSINETLVFTLSVLTSCGYGHLDPESPAGRVFTTFYVLGGLVICAVFAGEMLDLLVSMEIEALANAMKKRAACGPDVAGPSSEEDMVRSRRRHFVTGVVNLAALLTLSVALFWLCFGERFVDALYFAFVTTLKLDSICISKAVHCDHKWQVSSGGFSWWLLFTVLWYVVTYEIIGHFFVATSTYLGVDHTPRMTRLQSVSRGRLERMDQDGDGRVTKLEFLRDRLVQGGLCSADDIDTIFRNFDELDTDHSGILDLADVGQA